MGYLFVPSLYRALEVQLVLIGSLIAYTYYPMYSSQILLGCAFGLVVHIGLEVVLLVRLYMKTIPRTTVRVPVEPSTVLLSLLTPICVMLVIANPIIIGLVLVDSYLLVNRVYVYRNRTLKIFQ